MFINIFVHVMTISYLCQMDKQQSTERAYCANCGRRKYTRKMDGYHLSGTNLFVSYYCHTRECHAAGQSKAKQTLLDITKLHSTLLFEQLAFASLSNKKGTAAQ